MFSHQERLVAVLLFFKKHLRYCLILEAVLQWFREEFCKYVQFFYYTHFGVTLTEHH